MKRKTVFLNMEYPELRDRGIDDYWLSIGRDEQNDQAKIDIRLMAIAGHVRGLPGDC